MIDWLHLPPLSALRALAALAETGTTVEAGARLNVSHAAISQQIKTLETQLGLPLVRRGGRRLDLTPEGRELAQAMVEGMGGVAAVVERLTGRDALRPLLVTCTPTLAAGFLLPRLGDFQSRFPGTSLMLDPTPALREVGPGGADIALRYGAGAWPGLRAELLVESPIVIVAAPALVPGDGPAEPAALADLPWLQELGTTEASDFLAWQGARIEMRGGVTSLPGNLMIEAVRAGQGIAVTARAFVEADIAAGRLRLLFEDSRKKGYFILYREDALRPAARNFLHWLRRQREAAWADLPGVSTGGDGQAKAQNR